MKSIIPFVAPPAPGNLESRLALLGDGAWRAGERMLSKGGCMRIVLADLRASDGLVSKDTVAGGYGSRLVPFSRVTRIFCRFKKWLLESPSVQMAYLAAICAEKGHEVLWTQDRIT